MAREGVQSQLEGVKKELQVLAGECIRAFEVARMEQSRNPQVMKAIALCSSYASPNLKPKMKPMASSAIVDLWKRDVCHEDHAVPADKKQLATSILGQNMVDTLVEENHQPPDVRLGVAIILGCGG